MLFSLHYAHCESLMHHSSIMAELYDKTAKLLQLVLACIVSLQLCERHCCSVLCSYVLMCGAVLRGLVGKACSFGLAYKALCSASGQNQA